MKRIFIVLTFLSLCSSSLFAVGKISGRVIDKETKEAIIGANVTVENTLLGAATDFNGDYYIINIPEGKYNIIVSYIGYENKTFKNVVVHKDRTTMINAELEVEFIADDFSWGVYYDPRIKLISEISNIEFITNGYYIKKMSGLFPKNFSFFIFYGLTYDNLLQDIKIYETNFNSKKMLIDNIPFYQWSSLFNPQYSYKNHQIEISYFPNGYESENRMAANGLLKLFSYTGSRQFHTNFSIKYKPSIYQESENVDDSELELSASLEGPIGKNTTYFINHYLGNSSLPVEDMNKKINTSHTTLNLFFRPTRNININTYFGSEKINSFSLTNLALMPNMVYFYPDNYFNISFNNSNNELYLLPLNKTSNKIDLKTNYIISYKAYTEFYVQRQYNKQTIKFSEVFTDAFLELPTYNDFLFTAQQSEAESWTSGLVFNMQINKNNFIKTGIEYEKHQVNLKNDFEEIKKLDYRFEPELYSMFLQDKIETKRYVINAGIRSQYFSLKRNVPVYKNNKQWKFNPRIGIAYRINTDIKLYANYTSDFILPDFYKTTWQSTKNSGFFPVGNRLNPNSKLIDCNIYEMGYEQSFNYCWKFSVNLSQKELKDRLAHVSDIIAEEIYSTKQKRQGMHLSLAHSGRRYYEGSLAFNYLQKMDTYYLNQEFFETEKNDQISVTSYLRFYSDSKWGLKIANYYPFSNIDLSVLYQWNSSGKTKYDVFSRNFNFTNLKLNKKLYRKKIEFDMFLAIHNLFNQKMTVNTESITYSLFNQKIYFGFDFRF